MTCAGRSALHEEPQPLNSKRAQVEARSYKQLNELTLVA